MMSKRLCVLFLAVLVVRAEISQSDDIPPIENENQYPPDNKSTTDDDIPEGSGHEPIEAPQSVPETTSLPILEDIQQTGTQNEETTTQAQEDQSWQNSCTSNFEGGTDNFVVDCSGNQLTEFPKNLNPRTTTLNIRNNKITLIPKEISLLVNLTVLDASDNSIMELALGSVSELKQLRVLKLSNNRLIEYPSDLKNSIDLLKLEELDLGGNDMRGNLSHESFSNFKSLRKVTLPSLLSNPILLKDMCSSIKGIEAICTESCDKTIYECEEASPPIEGDFIDAVHPSVMDFPEDNTETTLSDDTQTGTEDLVNGDTTEKSVPSESTTKGIGSARFANPQQATVTPPTQTDETEKEAKVGATTADTTTGGVDKSVIGMIVAGMVVIVAGITIKKNWSSIKKRFSSEPRAAERSTANGNGTTPEEVPLQEKDKSPV